MPDSTIQGYIHSTESCGTVDGPGIRYVIFMQGCPLRCQYCHNPDTWKLQDGRIVTAGQLVSEAEKYKSYMRFSGGGVTVSGGEPLLQTEFVQTFFRLCHEEGISTALDTAGSVPLDRCRAVLEHTDLVLLDIKHMDPDRYRDLTAGALAPTLEFARYLQEQKIPTWIRYVLVPGLTDQEEGLHRLGAFLQPMENIQRVDLLPFHKLGEYKWKTLQYPYTLWETPEPTKAQIAEAAAILRQYGVPLQSPS